jgi:5-methylcytosine-specific restriction endonuclease McrA
MTGTKRELAFRDPQSTWYKLNRWKKRARHQLLVEPLCAYCLEVGRVRPATVADHIEPVAGSFERMWLGRLQSICASCDRRVKRVEERRGWRPGFNAAGEPLDSKHPALQPRPWAIDEG